MTRDEYHADANRDLRLAVERVMAVQRGNDACVVYDDPRHFSASQAYNADCRDLASEFIRILSEDGVIT